ncbi:hypothetical protein [Aeromonas caviae]|uniref:hypothetical protein n=1 Tax=Aeromonas TaxID=642 RepID=UPI00265D8C41|nr:hypothetical protein [Aeromonas caviae]WKL90189.1 hypothetical protein Q2F48_07275 [Aeromonas caviae]
MSELSDVTFDVICVTYNCDEPNKLETKIRKMFSYARLDIRVLKLVDTSRDFHIGHECISQQKINDYFEFTGYHYGLKWILNCSDFGGGRRNIVFINDTLFNSHVYLYSVFQLANIKRFLLKLSSPRQSFITGHSQNKFHGPVVPTCLFCISGYKSELNKFSLFPLSLHDNSGEMIESSRLDIADIFVKDSSLFEAHIDAWLRPKAFFKGWYKLDYYNGISDSDFRRKKIAIFLEHSLLYNNEVFLFHDLKAPWLYFLSKIDRLYQNIIKVCLRGSLFVKKNINKVDVS